MFIANQPLIKSKKIDQIIILKDPYIQTHIHSSERMSTNFISRIFFTPIRVYHSLRKTKQLHAWFSATSSEKFGYCIYLDSENAEVKLTEVNESNIPFSKWPDLEYMGRVHTFVKPVWHPNHNFYPDISNLMFNRAPE